MTLIDIPCLGKFGCKTKGVSARPDVGLPVLFRWLLVEGDFSPKYIPKYN